MHRLGLLLALKWQGDRKVSAVAYKRISQVCGVAVVLIAGVAVVGWFIKSKVLIGIDSQYIPMAPNTALAFLLMGLSLFLLSIGAQKTPLLIFVRASAVLVIVVAAARLFEYVVGVDLRVDKWVFRFPGESFGPVPTGKMAFFTAVNFLFVAAAIFISSVPERGQFTNDSAKALSAVAAFVGLVFLLGYLYGNPLFYDSSYIPMALNTSIAFLLLGVGIVVNASVRDLLERQRSQEELRKAHEELERRVEERTAELARVNEKLASEIAERKQLEEQLLQAQKMEAIGRLAGGVAHDFNNLLTAIIGYSQLALQRIPPDDPLRHDLDEIRKAGERAATLTRQLLAFSRKQVLQPKVLDLNAVVASTSKMLHRLIGEDIRFRTILDPALKRVKADPGQIEQVLMNLAVNARDAMPNGGSLSIETANVYLDEEYARHHVEVQPGRYVMLAVSDTGCGMSAEVLSHIFEPFFTTKEQGRGTGLGLAMVYGIIKQSGGHIWVYSEPGKGTTFKLYLPLAEEADSAAEQALEQTAFLPTGTETILLAEDDAQVREFASRVLRELGYKVIEATDGQQALKEAEQTPNIDILLTDVVMPYVGGKELSERLRSVRPGIKVLFLSGYTEYATLRQGMLGDGDAFLHKPFAPGELARKVREVLDGDRKAD
jgi:signal transduction histidine kinase/ActR/RegA family two-component response regulator